MKSVKDPVCGMKVDVSKAKKKSLFIEKGDKTEYFCSKDCMDKASFGLGRFIPYILILVLVVGAIWSFLGNFMVKFMGWFFVVVSLLKFPDWKGFVNTFSSYDVLAKRSRFYAWIYPLLELGIGILFLMNLYVKWAAGVLLFIMFVGSIGVGIKLFSKEKFKCACLGTTVKIPLTKFTFIEDIVMGLMALLILVGFS